VSDDSTAAGSTPESAPLKEVVKEAVKEERAERKKNKKKGKKDSSSLGSSRGIETMFRTSYRVHMDLSSLADTKANIMISINGLMISITLAAVGPTIQQNALLLLPSSVLLVGCSIALVFAVLAARPRVSSRPLTLEMLKENNSNILFFGNFVNLPEDDFVEGMKSIMQDTDRLYVNMIRDLYGLGQVLKKKFELLRISYNVFMVALIAGVVLFVYVFATNLESAEDILRTPGLIPGS